MEAQEKTPIFIVWEQQLVDGEVCQSLRAVDTTRELADRHKVMVQNEIRHLRKRSVVEIEAREMNHLYGDSMLKQLPVHRPRTGD
jgi:hypothetical protein